MTSRDLARMGHRYMRLLGLDEWIRGATFKLVRDLKDSEGGELFATCWWHTEERKCEVIVSAGMDERNTRSSLIHELLHLRLEGHLPPISGQEYDAGYEYALNCLTETLMRAWAE